MTRKGKFKAVVLDTVLSEHNEFHVAYKTVWNYLKNHKEIESGFIEYPEKIEVTIKWNDEYISIHQMAEVTIGNITSNSAIIYIPNTKDMAYVYIRYRELGGEWKETTKSLTNIKSPGLLKPNTQYEYIVYWMFKNELELRSKLLTFTTL